MDLDEKQLIGSILSDDEDQEFQRKKEKKRSKLSLNAREFQPHDQQELGNQLTDSMSILSTAPPTYPYVRLDQDGRQNSKHYSYTFSAQQKEQREQVQQCAQNNSKKHSTMQPLPPNVAYQQFSSHPIITEPRKFSEQVLPDDAQFRMYLEQVSGNQNASRQLQKIFDSGNARQRKAIFETVMKNVIKVSKDLFGNYTVQKIYQSGEEQWKYQLLHQMKGHFIELSKNNYGCRVMQKVVEFVSTNQILQQDLINDIKPHIKLLVQDPNGSFVVLKCLESFPQELMNFIIPVVEEQVSLMSQQTYGCRIIQFLLQYYPNTQVILQNIMIIAEQLCCCEFGNYLVQHILKNGPAPEQQQICQIIRTKLCQLSINKYGSNTVEKYLDLITTEEGKLITSILLNQQNNNYQFIILAQNPYGNYVIKKYFTLQPHIYMPILQVIRSDPDLMLKVAASEYGQKLYQLLEKHLSNS